MTIESIEPNRFIIVLDYSEAGFLHRADGKRYPRYSPAALACLLSLASVKSGVSLCSKKISVSPYSGKDRLYLVVTISPQLFLPAGNSRIIMIKFTSLDVLFAAADKISADEISDSSLYKQGEKYVLMLKLSPEKHQRVTYILSEYGNIRSVTPITLARIREYAVPIIEARAIEKLKK